MRSLGPVSRLNNARVALLSSDSERRGQGGGCFSYSHCQGKVYVIGRLEWALAADCWLYQLIKCEISLGSFPPLVPPPPDKCLLSSTLLPLSFVHQLTHVEKNPLSSFCF